MKNIHTKDQKMLDTIANGLAELKTKDVVNRVWQKDYTLWSESPKEISNRLDWLTISGEMSERVTEINDFVDQIKGKYEYALLLGMGGSSLAPEVFSKIFGKKEGYPELLVLDTTEPERIKDIENVINPDKTLFITSTKSGGTVETISLMKYFYTLLTVKQNKEFAGNNFIAITDPGSGLEDMAKELNFSKIFLNNPNIGGRFSALSMFGLVPAAISGIDISGLIERAEEAVSVCKNSDDIENNTGAVLGNLMGITALNGKNKLSLLIDDAMAPIGVWIEQLVAESTGKHGKGVLPVDKENFKDTSVFDSDRYFVVISKNDSTFEKEVNALEKENFTILKMSYKDEYDIAAQFMIWEFATAVAGNVLQIHPFDQPDVESAKIQAREMVSSFMKTGKLPEVAPDYQNDEFYTAGYSGKAVNIADITNEYLTAKLDQKNNGYISIHAYINMSDDNIDKLESLKDKLRNKYKKAVTIGFGPRFLHSTGQLHKGDDNSGVFIQITSEKHNDLDVPDEAGETKSGITFGTLNNAQALGDRQALLNNKRDVLKIHIKKDVDKIISELLA